MGKRLHMQTATARPYQTANMVPCRWNTSQFQCKIVFRSRGTATAHNRDWGAMRSGATPVREGGIACIFASVVFCTSSMIRPPVPSATYRVPCGGKSKVKDSS